jgi:hypothetical protein
MVQEYGLLLICQDSILSMTCSFDIGVVCSIVWQVVVVNKLGQSTRLSQFQRLAMIFDDEVGVVCISYSPGDKTKPSNAE